MPIDVFLNRFLVIGLQIQSSRSRGRSRMRFAGSLTHAFWVRIHMRFASYVAFGYLEVCIEVRSHMHAFSHTSYHQRKLGSSYGQIELWWRVGWNFTLHNNTSQKNWPWWRVVCGACMRSHIHHIISYLTRGYIAPTHSNTETRRIHTHVPTFMHTDVCTWVAM